MEFVKASTSLYDIDYCYLSIKDNELTVCCTPKARLNNKRNLQELFRLMSEQLITKDIYNKVLPMLSSGNFQEITPVEKAYIPSKQAILKAISGIVEIEEAIAQSDSKKTIIQTALGLGYLAIEKTKDMFLPGINLAALFEDELSPPSITSQWNDNYDTTGFEDANFIKFTSSSGSKYITGFAAPEGNLPVSKVIYNSNSSNRRIYLTHLDSYSDPENRINTGGSNIRLDRGESVVIKYSPSDQVWTIIAKHT